MNSPKYLLTPAALSLAMLFPSLSHAADDRQQFTILSENFNHIAQLRNWTTVNNSNPPGQTWFQGNPGIFAAAAGAPSSYIAANFLSAANGHGWIDNWLITPQISLFGPSMLSLFVRGDPAPGLRDTLEIRFSAEAASTDTSNFSTLVSTFGGLTAFPSTWEQLSV
ncbi:MAG: choice-of-anchor J domain-containing protein, partial [Massilia sp.]|nr:choice-of-anchor J domain-containing protein [Massilia sp.]